MEKRRRAALIIFGLGLCLPFADASRAADSAGDRTASAASEELATLKRYGAATKSCDGWTDGCALCARRPDGTLGCSRLGVDCQITEISCTQPARDPKTGKTPPPE